MNSEEAWPGIALLQEDSRLAIGAAAEVYRAILHKIEANDYNVFTQRASVSLSRKLHILWNVWRRMQRENSR
ncbi:MAG: squalene/phytoene synthase family protein [Roseiflexaceae bacterium]|nr:squalene/phytoene synthase family protein [Roseiflexaceae bacterium]